jgi:hypothetical protein
VKEDVGTADFTIARSVTIRTHDEKSVPVPTRDELETIAREYLKGFGISYEDRRMTSIVAAILDLYRIVQEHHHHMLAPEGGDHV